jgi:hypothetical protein
MSEDGKWMSVAADSSISTMAASGEDDQPTTFIMGLVVVAVSEL